MNKLSLADFVAETLSSISDGVRRAQQHSKDHDGVPIAPNSVDGQKFDIGDQLIKFNVTVEVTAGSAKTGKGELGGPLLAVVSGKLGGEVTSDSKSANHQAIEFAIPMHFHLRWSAATAAGTEGK